MGFRDSATIRRPNHSLQARQTAKPRKDWLVRNVELSKSCTLANCQIHQTAVDLPPLTNESDEDDFEPSLIDPTNVTNCPKQVHQPQHKRGLKCQINHGKVICNMKVGTFLLILAGHIRAPHWPVASVDQDRRSTSKSLKCPKRPKDTDNEQVSAKSKSMPRLAMKEDGRNEDFPDNTAWGNPMQPHPSPTQKKVRQEDCCEDFLSTTAG